MNDPVPDVGQNEEMWRDFLTGANSREARFRRLLKRLPTDPRCELCAAPFAGPEPIEVIRLNAWP